MIVTPEERRAIEQQAIAEYPYEACGVIMTRGRERRLLRCRNAQNELHARDPHRFPRDGRTAYRIDDADRLRMIRLEQDGWSVAVIYHSHVDAGAYFSATDRQQALLHGEPLYPDVTYLVVSVVDRRVAGAAAFRWDPAARDFVPVPLGEPWAGPPAPPAPVERPGERR